MVGRGRRQRWSRSRNRRAGAPPRRQPPIADVVVTGAPSSQFLQRMRQKGVGVQTAAAHEQLLRTHPAPGHRIRTYGNNAERRFVEMALSEGWKVTKRGWPDFICFRGNEVCVVEVKPHSSSEPRPSQSRILELLRAHGISALVWSPSGGFKPSGGWPMRKE